MHGDASSKHHFLRLSGGLKESTVAKYQELFFDALVGRPIEVHISEKSKQGQIAALHSFRWLVQECPHRCQPVGQCSFSSKGFQCLFKSCVRLL